MAVGSGCRAVPGPWVRQVTLTALLRGCRLNGCIAIRGLRAIPEKALIGGRQGVVRKRPRERTIWLPSTCCCAWGLGCRRMAGCRVALSGGLCT